MSINNDYISIDKESLTYTPDNYDRPQTIILSANHDASSFENKTSIITLTSHNVINKSIEVTIVNIDENKTLTSISAIYTQGDKVVYPTTSLNSLKSNLVVTATFDNGSTENVTDYTLSGELSVGTSRITVTYQEQTTTFDVTVSEKPETSGNAITVDQMISSMNGSGLDTKVKKVDGVDNQYEVLVPGGYYPNSFVDAYNNGKGITLEPNTTYTVKINRDTEAYTKMYNFVVTEAGLQRLDFEAGAEFTTGESGRVLLIYYVNVIGAKYTVESL